MTHHDDLNRKVVSSVPWIALDKWGARLSTLVVFAILGRLLDPSEFGIVALASVYIAFLAVFVDSGFSQSLIQRAELDDEHASTAFWISLGIGTGLAAVLSIGAPIVGSLTGHDDIGPVLQVLSISLPLTAAAGVPDSLLQREFGYRALAIRRAVATLTGAVVAIALGIYGAGVWALVAQILTTSAVGLVVLWRLSPWRPSFSFSREAARNLWSFGSSVLGIELVALANAQADKLLVGVALGPTALGYYFVGSRIVQIMLEMLVAVIGTLSLPTFSRMQHDLRRMVRALERLTFASSAIAFPAYALAIALAAPIIAVAFGPQWDASVPVMQWLAPSAALSAVSWFDKGLLLGAGKPRLAFMLAIGQTVLGLALLVAALPFGLVAVAISRSVRVVLFWPVRLITLHRAVDLDVGRYTKQFAPAAIAATVAALAVAAWQQSALAIHSDLVAVVVLGAAGGAMYVGLMVVFARAKVAQITATALGGRTPGWVARAAAA